MLVQAFIKTALIYLVLGVVLGGFLLADKGVGLFNELWELRPLHIEWLLLGWMLQLALGGATWIMPRPHDWVPHKILGWLSYALLNSGLLLSTLAHLTHAWSSDGNVNWSFILAAIAEVSGVLCFGIYIWSRASFAPPKPL